jgi:hypothetical protein
MVERKGMSHHLLTLPTSAHLRLINRRLTSPIPDMVQPFTVA